MTETKDDTQGFWHFQLMKHVEPNGEVWYGIHEMFPTLGKGAYTENPVPVMGESLEDVKWQLKAMLNDIDRHGCRDYEEDT